MNLKMADMDVGQLEGNSYRLVESLQRKNFLLTKESALCEADTV
jgi:hypothetical protein